MNRDLSIGTSVDAGDELARLSQNFTERARRDALLLVQMCDALSLAPGTRNSEDLGHMASLLHRLAGTAGTFGFSALGANARQLFNLTAVIRDSPDEDFSVRLLALSDGAHAMVAELDAGCVQPAIEEAGADDHWGDAIAKVCVIADDAAVVTRLTYALEGFGYKVWGFQTLLQLAEQVPSLPFSAIIVALQDADSQLAELKRVRAMLADPVPVLAIAARSSFADALAAVRAGVEGYFVEPVDLSRLEARMAYLIDRNRREGFRVLLVDDDADLIAVCRHVLEQAGMTVASVDEPSQVMPLLSEFRPEVILMDIQMPQCTGPELAQVIRLHDEWLHVPIVYMSTQSGGADQLLATRKAGEGFVSKPIDTRELVATIRVNGRNARQMVETASRDALTGLLKKSSINEYLAAELERAWRSAGTTSVAMIDIDNFKLVNDRHGHLVGDLVIRTLAAVLRQRLRSIDGIGRVGGEEFLVVLSDCTAEQAGDLMEGVRTRFAEIQFDGVAAFRASMSAGIAEAKVSDQSASELVDRADKALYLAKARGRNCIVAAAARDLP